MSSRAVAYGFGQRLVELGAIAAFVVLAAWSFWRFAAATQLGFVAIVIALVAMPAGWLAADLLSGLLHWALDTFGSARTPFVGRAFIRPFREHHADPQAMTQHDFVETHGASCFAALPFLAAACVLPLDSWAWSLVQALLVFVGLGALITNQCHKWAHMDEVATPKLVRWAQKRGLVLPPEHHWLHHSEPFNSHFCMSCGWFNRPLDAVLRAWR